jgi:hypothetical protein
MDRNDKGLALYLAQKQSITSAKAMKALAEMSDDDFVTLVAEYESATTPKTNGKLVVPEPFSVIGKITDISPLHGENEGSSVVTITTTTGSALAFVLTNKQVGDETNRGFSIQIGKTFSFNLERRIEHKTQYVDRETGMIKTHTKTSNGFVACTAIDPTEFMISRLGEVAPERANATANILLRMHELSLRTVQSE